MFKASKEKEKDFAQVANKITTPANYLIAKNDYLEFSIYTNKGESIIDPTSELAKQISLTSGSVSNTFRIKYLIQSDGCADLPIIGHIKLDSMTLHQADSLLSLKYGQFYQDVFVLSRVINRKIYILGMGSGGALAVAGGVGGGLAGSSNARVFEMEKENLTLFEVIASTGGIGRYSHANRLKVIRGNLKNPTIFTIDLTRWDSFQKSNLIMQPNDVIYVEPSRRGVLEFLGDLAGLSAFASTILSIILITRL